MIPNEVTIVLSGDKGAVDTAPFININYFLASQT